MDKLLIEIHQSLGISEIHLKANKLKFQLQPDSALLEIVEIDFEGKPFILQASAAKAWRKMKDFARQIESILTQIAIPGFSEHHSGLAVDIHADGINTLEEEFELTQEFLWLKENASRFDFRLSYPRDNDQGIIYEPWHWYYTGR